LGKPSPSFILIPIDTWLDDKNQIEEEIYGFYTHQRWPKKKYKKNKKEKEALFFIQKI